DQRARQRHVLQLRAALQPELARLVVELLDVAGRPERLRVEHLVAGIELVLLRGERERMGERLGRRNGIARERDPPDRLDVELGELLRRSALAGKEGPPDRLRLAPV